MGSIKRYSIIGTTGGWQEYECDNGEFVKYEDILNGEPVSCTCINEKLCRNVKACKFYGMPFCPKK